MRMVLDMRNTRVMFSYCLYKHCTEADIGVPTELIKNKVIQEVTNMNNMKLKEYHEILTEMNGVNAVPDMAYVRYDADDDTNLSINEDVKSDFNGVNLSIDEDVKDALEESISGFIKHEYDIQDDVNLDINGDVRDALEESISGFIKHTDDVQDDVCLAVNGDVADAFKECLTGVIVHKNNTNSCN